MIGSVRISLHSRLSYTGQVCFDDVIAVKFV